jgi:hypothetical protein
LQDICTRYCLQSIVDQIVIINQKAIRSQYDLIEVCLAFGGPGLFEIKATYECN